MYAEVAWVLVSSGTQVQSQIIVNLDYLPDYISISYGYGQSDRKTEKRDTQRERGIKEKERQRDRDRERYLYREKKFDIGTVMQII